MVHRELLYVRARDGRSSEDIHPDPRLERLLIIIFLLAVLSIYWGALWQTPAHTHNLNNWVVDFDGGEVGQFVSSAVVASGGAPTALSWDEKAWTIVASASQVIVNKNATNTLNAAVVSVNDSYIADDAISVYVAEARSENAYRIVIHPMVVTLLDGITEAFNAQYVSEIPGRSSNPISYTIINTRPFDVAVASAVDFVALIYLLILAFVVTMEHYAARVNATHLEDRLTFNPRTFLPVNRHGQCFYSLLSLAFQVPFNRFYGSAGFVIYWMMSWMAMCALGGAVESMITILTPRFISFFLLLWIIANVSVCVFPPTLLPGVYRYGYAMPFYNVQQTIRSIIFGTRNQMGLNFGVQVAWILVSWCTLVLFQLFMRRRAVHAHNAEIAAAAAESLSDKQGP
ncbi:hypothetical protein BJV77DRAFT_1066938 [Russula vinacea]|nr:hypothetical protein BJV77DRAFT_1066938 [Russula vinacea]